MSEMKLYSGAGERLYLTSQERVRFEEQSRLQPRDTMTFAMTMLYTGCRISEALNIQIKHVDLESRPIMILSLKKRGQGHVRSIPVPEKLIDSLNLVHGLRESKSKNDLLWDFTRMTGWRKIKEIMVLADIT